MVLVQVTPPWHWAKALGPISFVRQDDFSRSARTASSFFSLIYLRPQPAVKAFLSMSSRVLVGRQMGLTQWPQLILACSTKIAMSQPWFEFGLFDTLKQIAGQLHPKTFLPQHLPEYRHIYLLNDSESECFRGTSAGCNRPTLQKTRGRVLLCRVCLLKGQMTCTHEAF